MLPSLKGKMASFMGTFVSFPAPPKKHVYKIATEARDVDWRASPMCQPSARISRNERSRRLERVPR